MKNCSECKARAKAAFSVFLGVFAALIAIKYID